MIISVFSLKGFFILVYLCVVTGFRACVFVRRENAPWVQFDSGVAKSYILYENNARQRSQHCLD